MIIKFIRILILPYLSQKKIQKLQEKKFLEIFRHAKSNVAFYRQMYSSIDESDITSLEDLQKLPVFDQFEMRNARETDLIDDALNINRLLKFTTSGTANRHMAFYISKKEDQLRQLKSLRSLIQLGWKPWWTGVQIWREMKTKKHSFFQKLLNKKRKIIPVRLTPEMQYKELIKRPPQILYGLTSVMERLAEYLIDTGKRINVKLLISGGEVKYPLLREKFKKAFNHEGYERYGAIECGIMAYPVPNSNQMYLDEDGFIFEVLDEANQPTQTGKGKIVITSLDQKTTPLIRYDIGDFVTLAKNPAKGRIKYRQISSIDGRIIFNVKLKNGRFLTFQTVLGLAFALKGVKKIQLIQDQHLRCKLKYVKQRGYDDNKIKDDVLKYLELDNQQLQFEACESLLPEASGKYNLIKKVEDVNNF